MVSFTNFFLSAESESLLEKFAVWYQNSVFYELLNYFKEQYFTVEFGAYENFSVGTGASSVAQNLILAIILGTVIATGMAVYTRSVLGGFVRTLLKSGANSTENAKKLSELGYFRSAAIRYELSRGVTLRKVIRCTQEDAFLAEEAAKAEVAEGEGKSQNPYTTKRFRPDFLTAQYYIPEDLRIRAELRFEKKGSGWGLFVLIAVVVVIVAALLGRFLPDIFQFADNLISMMAPK